MKKLLSIIPAIVAAIAIAAPAVAQNYPLYVAGDFNGWNAAGNVMAQISPNVWQVSLALGGGGGGRHEFKVTEGDWNWNVPSSGNSWLYTDADGNVTITYDQNTYADGWSPSSGRIGVNIDPGTWTAVGDWEGWNNANPATAMTSIGGGVYELATTIASPGTYQYKAVDTGSWDAIGADSRSVNASTLNFTTTDADQGVDFFVNALSGAIEVTVIPEPATVTLVGIGLLGALALCRRKS